MDAKTLDTIGLALNLVGGTIWFFYGFPQPLHQEGVAAIASPKTRLPDGNTVAEHDKEVRKTKGIYLFRSKCAFFIIVAGFAFQFYAIWK